jgi:hypothetical protein
MTARWRSGWNDSLGNFSTEHGVDDQAAKVERGFSAEKPSFLWCIHSGLLTLAEEMKSETALPVRLAPLQQVMLGDSLADQDAGHHVEQVEVVFSAGAWRERVPAAWEETVARTEALRIAFLIQEGMATGVESVEPRMILNHEPSPPVAWEEWLAADRCLPLLAPHEVPWRATYWPQSGRFIWTFHHALLDGRSIAAVLRGLFARVGGRSAEPLALSHWNAPSPASIALAGAIFQENFHHPQMAARRQGLENAEDGQALEFLGPDFRRRLESLAEQISITAATALTWSWGQAVAEVLALEVVVIEQVRCGAPQPGTAGFTMHTLPVTIHRVVSGGEEESLREFRTRLLALREIEYVSPEDFPPGVFPDVDQAGSSVIMVEHATLSELADEEMLESLELHESKGETLMATAHVLPDLRLQVEGPARHDFLDAWIAVLERLVMPSTKSGSVEALSAD